MAFILPGPGLQVAAQRPRGAGEQMRIVPLQVGEEQFLRQVGELPVVGQVLPVAFALAIERMETLSATPSNPSGATSKARQSARLNAGVALTQRPSRYSSA